MKKFNQKETNERNQRWRDFNQDVLPILGFYYDVSQSNPGAYVARETPKGNLTIYPKGDKIQLTDGSWVNGNIIEWLKRFVITEKML